MTTPGDASVVWERSGDWRIAFEPTAPRNELELLLPRLDELEGRSVKSNRRRQVLRVELPDGDAVFVKRDFCTRLLDAAVVWPRRSRVLQEFSNLRRVRSLGLRAAEPLCVAERRSGPALREGVLVTREIPAAEPLGPDRLWLEALGRVARRLHDAGGWHRDLHGGNALLSGGELVLVDLQKLRMLPFPLPVALRVQDVARLAHDESELERLLAGYGRHDAGFVRRLRRGRQRALRLRLHSRGRRCVTDSSGFRRETVGALRIHRRADIERAAVLETLEAFRASGQGRVADVRGGPPPGPAASPFRRGHGAREPGSPATADVAVRAFPPSWRPWPSGGMHAWRAAHAALVRGVETPTPLALVEERRGLRCRSWLLARAESLLEIDAADEARAAGEASRADCALAHLEATGVSLRRPGPGVFAQREGEPTPVLADPAALRLHWWWW